MAWDYDYRVGGTSLSDYCQAVTIPDESGGGLIGDNLHLPGTDGERVIDKTFGPSAFGLKTTLRYTNAGGTITHVDGAPGHVYENLSALKKIFRKQGPILLLRDMPHAGTVVGEVELMSEPVRGEADHVFIWPLKLLGGSWRGNSQNTATGNPPTITTSGDTRIDDFELEFSGVGTVSDIDLAGIAYSIESLAGTFPLIVYMGPNKRVEQGGSPDPGRVIIGHEAWFRMDPDASVVLTTDVSVTVRWYDKWS